ncbi:hemolysin family protein [Ancrocorticia populi]|uniref:hemolysin family protein n=1 Tax=Ancrocorticia populi TaxID=2175228 RepID=UPI003F915F80
MSTPLALGLTVLLLALNAFFVASEFALTGSRRSRVEPLVKESAAARKVLWSIEHLSRMLAAAQLGVTLCSVGLGALAEPAIAHLLAIPLESLGLSPAVVHGIAFVVALLLVVSLHVVLGEMVPKNVSVTHPEKSALKLLPALLLFEKVFYPVVAVLNWCSLGVLKLFRVQPKDEVDSAFTASEVASIVAASEAAGVLSDEQGLITGALEFSDHTAREVMVPVEDVAGVARGVTAAQIERSVAVTGFSRFLVRANGNVIGYIHMKDILNVAEASRDEPLRDWVIRPLVSVHPDDEVEDALAVMQRSRTHLASVISEGDVIGIVFLEDILEELVGEVRDSMQRDERRQ